MGKKLSGDDLRAHADLTRRLAAKAATEGNSALARELARIADAVERELREAA